MAAAKRAFSEAARSALHGDKTAADQAKEALREVEGIAHAEITGHFTRRRVEVDSVFRAMRLVDAAWRDHLKRTTGRK